MLESQSRAYMQNLSENMACWFGPQGQIKLAKNSKTPPLLMSPLENHKPKTEKKIFATETKRLPKSVEGLNSFLALAAGDSWPKKCRPICRPNPKCKTKT